jgi:hypothetical protein
MPSIHSLRHFASEDWRMNLEDRKFVVVTICIFAGIWFGSFVIPLDWNVAWQVWPISVTHGATMGYFIGSFFAFFMEYFDKIKEF